MLMAFRGQLLLQVVLVGAIVGAIVLTWYESQKKKT